MTSSKTTLVLLTGLAFVGILLAVASNPEFPSCVQHQHSIRNIECQQEVATWATKYPEHAAKLMAALYSPLQRETK